MPIDFKHALPVASVMMSRKTELLYNRVFAYLKDILPDWYPTVITRDFGKALRIALRKDHGQKVVCRSQTVLCFFLKSMNPATRRVYKMCHALPLLPAHIIEAGYDRIVTFAQQACGLQNGLRALEHEALVTLASLQRGLNTISPSRPRYLLTNSSLNTLTTRLEGEQYFVPEFLEASSHQLDNVHNDIYNVAGDDEDDNEEVGVDSGRSWWSTCSDCTWPRP
ncbi:hypothetical protein J6590_019254 [Homalodisca vitripennis]|nr:hypothetical protein J6590_019254 [Homalodisca vitripennis]